MSFWFEGASRGIETKKDKEKMKEKAEGEGEKKRREVEQMTLALVLQVSLSFRYLYRSLLSVPPPSLPFLTASRSSDFLRTNLFVSDSNYFEAVHSLAAYDAIALASANDMYTQHRRRKRTLDEIARWDKRGETVVCNEVHSRELLAISYLLSLRSGMTDSRTFAPLPVPPSPRQLARSLFDFASRSQSISLSRNRRNTETGFRETSYHSPTSR